ncbi:uncharacterized protein LOC110753602 [Prunus avium]|uniref:Uncharacterized protein LOC110753602 n=1 Tax=Prunus avium TaxID=42229 RepID=A0A6P5S9N2_PRUAV|nr:uncharacterized protein LOC110753602 [Prunus avium]
MSKMKPDRKPPLAKSPIRLRPRRVLGSNSNCMPTPAGRSEIGFEQTDKILTGGSLRKSEKARRTGTWEMEEAELRPEYRSISWELRALEKMVTGEELGKEDYCGGGGDTDSSSSHRLSSLNSSPLFERGRFYEEYSARRNERLNRKNKIKVKEGGCETNYSTTAASASASASKCKYNNKLGVTVESAKRNSFTSTRTTTSSRKLQSLRKSVSAAYSVVETQQAPTPTPAPAPAPRYMLRSLNKENMKPPLPQPTLYSSHQNHKSANRGGRKTGAPTPTPTPTPRVGYY